MNKYKFALFACAFVWGFGYVAMDHLIATSNPMMAIAIRFLAASALVFVLGFKKIYGKFKENIVAILILGSILYVAFFFQTIGLALTTTSKNAFLTATNVIWTPILVSFLYKTKISKNIKIGSITMIVGIALISFDGISKFNVGDILTLICAIFFAIHIILINKYAKDDNVEVLVFGQLFITGIIGLIITLLTDNFYIHPGSEFMMSFVFVIVFSTALCFFLQNYGLSNVDSSAGAIILSLESMFGVIAAMLIDHEPVNLITIVGFMVMFGSILIAERKEV